MLGAVLDRILDVPLDQVVPVSAHRAVDEGVEPRARDLVLALPSRGLDRLVEHVDALFGVALRRRARDGDPRVGGDRLVAEALADLLRTACALETQAQVGAHCIERLRMKDVCVLASLRPVGSERRGAGSASSASPL